MKPNFSKSVGRLRAMLLLLLFGLALSVVAAKAADSTANITGTINNQNIPQIDATNFYNSGNWNINTDPSPYEALPYETTHTLNYTNEGTMIGTVGWEFDYGTNSGGSGGRSMSASFFNDSPATIQAVDGFIVNPPVYPPNLYPPSVSYLLISATNIVNEGTLIAGAGGEIVLTGTNVTLSRSDLEIGSIPETGSVNNFPSTGVFFPDTAIYDKYWAQTNRSDLHSDAIWNGTTATLPPFVPFAVTEPCGLAGTAMLSFTALPFPLTDSTNYVAGLLLLTVTNNSGMPTNVLVATNIIYQAAFVNITDPNISGTIGFTPSTTPSNNFQTVSVELQSTNGDTLFLVDTLASATGRGLLTNYIVDPVAACSGTTFRPTNYIVERVDFNGLGSSGSGVPPANFFYPTNFSLSIPGNSLSHYTGWSNRVVFANYAAYSFFVDDQASEPPSNPGGNTSSVTNLQGRIQISAANLNLYDTQIRGGGEVVIQAGNLVNSQYASIDCENLSYNLGSTNGYLNVTNLALPSVVRFRGTVSECSAVWTNLTTVVTPNFIASNTVSSGGVTNVVYVESDVTNTVQIGVYAWLVDASQLASESPVTVYDLLLHSTNIVISDSMNVIESFLLDGQSFTLNGRLTFPGTAPLDPVSGTPFSGNPIQNWVYTMAPTLRYFTNNGVLNIPNSAHFGDDGPTNYLAFINNGSITNGAETINSVNLQINNGKDVETIGNFSATAGTMILSNALISAAGDIYISANTLMIDPSTLSASRSLNFAVTTNLSDAGAGSGNVFSCDNGFNLFVSPLSGNLLGSTIVSVIPGRAEIGHAWAGSDLGATAGGLSSNVAIGTLRLVAQSPSQLPTFHFYGTTGNNAMYVKTLDLSQLTTIAANLARMIQIDPGMKIYFSQVILGFTPPGSQTAASYLQAQFPGQFIQDPNVGQVVPPTIVISSTAYNAGGPSFVLTWQATAGATYSVLKTNVINGSSSTWPVIKTNYPPGGAAGGPLSYTDAPTTISPAFYRVRSP